MTPSELKYHVEQRDDEAHFFTRKTMSFFGDTMRNFGVCRATVKTEYDASGNYIGADGELVECWELYRKRAVKHGNSGSFYFACDDYRRVHAEKEVQS